PRRIHLERWRRYRPLRTRAGGKQCERDDDDHDSPHMRSIVLDAIVMTFATVRAVGRTIPGIEEGTSYGGPALVHRGQLVACIATNKQAEPNTLAVRMDFADRDLLIE